MAEYDNKSDMIDIQGDTYHHKATLFLEYFELQENFTFGPGRGKVIGK